MLNIFGKKEESQPDWMAQMNEIRERWFVFLEKLEARMNELGEASIDSLKQAYEEDTDQYKRTAGRMLSGIKGQYQQMRQKANDVCGEKVDPFYDAMDDQVEFGSRSYDLLQEFRDACRERHSRFEDLYSEWMERLGSAMKTDMEAEYQKILDEYERIKDKFHCKQCGGNITIEKIFFISTYITCPHCQTQNTFDPGSQARMLEHIGRSLAEQRCAGLLQAYESEQQKERDLYYRMHELKIGNIHSGSAAQKDTAATIKDLETQRQQAIANAPDLYRKYLRAMFDEWNKIVPDLAEQNEKFYQRLLNDFNVRG